MHALGLVSRSFKYLTVHQITTTPLTNLAPILSKTACYKRLIFTITSGKLRAIAPDPSS